MPSNQATTQAVVVTQSSIDKTQAVEQIALFNADGSPRETPDQAAARADAPAITSVVAAGATPTKAEYDALRVDVTNLRTAFNDLLAKLRTAGTIAT